jgi:hypothetical protein
MNKRGRRPSSYVGTDAVHMKQPDVNDLIYARLIFRVEARRIEMKGIKVPNLKMVS